jgi:hypothetical protein
MLLAYVKKRACICQINSLIYNIILLLNARSDLSNIPTEFTPQIRDNTPRSPISVLP